MGQLQTGRFERLAARTYSIKGPGAMVDLDETVLGVILLERQGGMESHLIQGWRTYGMRVGIGAVAAQFSWLSIHNPSGSGQLMVLDRFNRAAGGRMRMFRGGGSPPGFAASTPGVGLDTRMVTTSPAAAQLATFNTNIGGFGVHMADFDTTETIEWPVTIAEDGTFFWRSNNLNELLEVSLYWAERDAQPFEN